MVPLVPINSIVPKEFLLKLTGMGGVPRLEKLWADTKYHNHSLNGWLSEHGWYVIEVVSRPAGSKTFKVIKWR